MTMDHTPVKRDHMGRPTDQGFADKPVDMKPCPFCGRAVDMEDEDTLYPTGTGWVEFDNGGMILRSYRSIRDPSVNIPKEQWCYSMHCPVPAGGCDAEMPGDTKQEAIDKWNRRFPPSDSV
jgi:hypothetical protein